MTAQEAVAQVVGHGNGAIEARELVAAVLAVEKGMKTAPVEKEKGLFAPLDGLTDRLYQSPGEEGRRSPSLLFHVDNIDAGEIASGHPLRQFEELEVSRFRVAIGLNGGGCRAQNHRCRRLFRPHDRQIPRIVGEVLLLLV